MYVRPRCQANYGDLLDVFTFLLLVYLLRPQAYVNLRAYGEIRPAKASIPSLQHWQLISFQNQTYRAFKRQMAKSPETETTRLDDAARAGWLYYVADNSQDEIARKLGVSRQVAQRLVSLAVSEKLVRVWLDHPIAACMELAEQVKAKYKLRYCDVVPSDLDSSSAVLGIAESAGRYLERALRAQKPMILALGTGRSLRAAVNQLPSMDCPQHKVISLIGNVAPDGSASFYDVITKIADKTNAPHYPMSVPVFAATHEERQTILRLKSVQQVYALAAQANVCMVGIGTIGEDAALFVDGFVDRNEVRALIKAGAVGEITGRAFDANGSFIKGLISDRVVSAPMPNDSETPMIGVAMGDAKLRAIRGALMGRLVNGLITNECTATGLLA